MKHLHSIVSRLMMKKTLALLLIPVFLFTGFTEHKVSFLHSFALPAQETSAETELLILWKQSLTEEEVNNLLSEISTSLTVVSHTDNFTVCHPATNASDSLLSSLRENRMVVAAEENRELSLCSFDFPEYFSAQWSLENIGQYDYYYKELDFTLLRTSTKDVDINLPEAYELLPSVITSPVTVAIIDTGIDISHPALSSKIYTNEKEIPLNGIDDDGNGFIDDVNGWDFFHNDNTVFHYLEAEDGTIGVLPEDNDTHGTHCAGIIASTKGVQGVAGAADVRILPLKIHGGPNRSGSIKNAILAIKYAEQAGASVCNMSWGTSIYSETLEEAMRESSMLFVVAAGNNGVNNNATPMYPSNYDLPNMISVGFVDAYGNLSKSSNYGVSTVDIAAPGQDIYSTGIGGTYLYQSGSSMATPIVSGVAALLYSCGTNLYPQNVKEIILQTLKPLDSLVGYVRYPGIPDAAAALLAVDLLRMDSLPPAFTPTTGFDNSSLSIQPNPEDPGGSGIRILRYAQGVKPIEYFEKGNAGSPVPTNLQIHVSKSGRYTLYAGDYAGNETVQIVTVEEDTTPPQISATYRRVDDSVFTVHVLATDAESGIRRVRYLDGVHEPKDFLSAGFEVTPSGQNQVNVYKEGPITFCAFDYRGNKSVFVLDIKTVPAERMTLSSLEQTLVLGDSFQLVPFLFPVASTDSVWYSVDNPSSVYVDESGKISALMPGDVCVTVTAESGISRSCLVHIVSTPPALTFDPAEVFYQAPTPSLEPQLTPTPSEPLPTSELTPAPVDVPVELPLVPLSISSMPSSAAAL